jgi:hypothetical protein
MVFPRPWTNAVIAARSEFGSRSSSSRVRLYLLSFAPPA